MDWTVGTFWTTGNDSRRLGLIGDRLDSWERRRPGDACFRQPRIASIASKETPSAAKKQALPPTGLGLTKQPPSKNNLR